MLYANSLGVPNGEGVDLVCTVGEDGKPELKDAGVVNGEIFLDIYDMGNAR